MHERTVNDRLDVVDVLSQITFDNTVLDFKWKFEVSDDEPIWGPGSKEGWLVSVVFERPDTNTGKIGFGRGRDEIIWEGSTVSAVVKTAWLLVELVVRHELMEAFRWNGARIFNPHNRVEDLAALQERHG